MTSISRNTATAGVPLHYQLLRQQTEMIKSRLHNEIDTALENILRCSLTEMDRDSDPPRSFNQLSARIKEAFQRHEKRLVIRKVPACLVYLQNAYMLTANGLFGPSASEPTTVFTAEQLQKELDLIKVEDFELHINSAPVQLPNAQSIAPKIVKIDKPKIVNSTKHLQNDSDLIKLEDDEDLEVNLNSTPVQPLTQSLSNQPSIPKIVKINRPPVKINKPPVKISKPQLASNPLPKLVETKVNLPHPKFQIKRKLASDEPDLCKVLYEKGKVIGDVIYTSLPTKHQKVAKSPLGTTTPETKVKFVQVFSNGAPIGMKRVILKDTSVQSRPAVFPKASTGDRRKPPPLPLPPFKRMINKRAFQCPLDRCNEEYNTKLSLILHLRAEHYDKKEGGYQCNVDGCKKTFMQIIDFESHQIKVHNYKHYVCGLCEEVFPDSAQIGKHLLTHRVNSNIGVYQQKIQAKMVGSLSGNSKAPKS